MTRIAFIGLGNMGGGMAARQVAGGREVAAFAYATFFFTLLGWGPAILMRFGVAAA